jgi:hypothetical protein
MPEAFYAPILNMCAFLGNPVYPRNIVIGGFTLPSCGSKRQEVRRRLLN